MTIHPNKSIYIIYLVHGVLVFLSLNALMNYTCSGGWVFGCLGPSEDIFRISGLFFVAISSLGLLRVRVIYGENQQSVGLWRNYIWYIVISCILSIGFMYLLGALGF